MEHALKEGMSFRQCKTVAPSDTAAAHGSGMLEVFATPALATLMESAANHLVSANLPKGHTSLGVNIAVDHLKASPLGVKVEARATLVKIDGRKLLFELSANDEEGEIGKGTHTRIIVEVERFMAKLQKP